MMTKWVQIAEKHHGSQYEWDTNGVSIAEVLQTPQATPRGASFDPAQNKRRATALWDEVTRNATAAQQKIHCHSSSVIQM